MFTRQTIAVKTKIYSISKSVLITISIPVLTYLGAILRIYLPFTPVPVTFQTFMVLISAASTHWYIATSGQILYLLLGVLGVPVFANKLTGLTALLHPTSGYVVGFIVTSFFVSQLMKNKRLSVYKIVLILILGNFIIYFFGVIRLSFLYGIKKSILIGVLPFIYGDALKIILATPLLKILRRKLK